MTLSRSRRRATPTHTDERAAVWSRRLGRAAFWCMSLAFIPGAKVLYDGRYANLFPYPFPEYPEPGWTLAAYAACALIVAGVAFLVAGIVVAGRVAPRSRD